VYGAGLECALGPAPKIELAGRLLDLVAQRLEDDSPASGMAETR
jgi:hypothetical protein